jgi:protein-S-isoprenylcysteine O-methyltransferase Ste14
VNEVVTAYAFPFRNRPEMTAIFWVAFAIWIVPEFVASKVRRARRSDKHLDKGSLNVIAVLWCAGIGLDFIATRFIRSASIPGNAAFFIGVSLMLSGIVFRWYSASVLGKYFTFDVTVQNNQHLVEVGPYRYVRHPSYTGALLTLIGFGLALENWLAAFAGTFCLGLAYVYRIRVEEAALTAALGDIYRRYAKRTWRLLPFIF